MLREVSRLWGLDLQPARVRIGNASIDVDGASPDRSALVEITAQIGTPKPAQAHKLATDILKLGWARQSTGATRCAVVTWSEEVQTYLERPGAWLTAARVSHGIEVILVPRDEAAFASVLAARVGQDFYPRGA